MNGIRALRVGFLVAACVLPLAAPGQSVVIVPDVTSQPPTSAVDEQGVPPQEPPEFDAYQVLENVRTLLAEGKVQEAEQELRTARDHHPTNHLVPYSHGDICDSYVRAGRFEDALRHAQALVDFLMQAAGEHAGYMEGLGERLVNLVDIAARLGGPQQVEETLDGCERKARAQEGISANALAAITVQLALYWANSGRATEGRALLSLHAQEAVNVVERSPDDTIAVLRASALLKGQVNLEAAAMEDGHSTEAWSTLLDFLLKHAQLHPADDSVMHRFASQHLQRAQQLVVGDPEGAAAVLDRVETFEQYKLPLLTDQVRRDYWNWSSGSLRKPLMELRIRIEESRERHAQIGMPATYLDQVDGWSNGGDDLAAESLKGEVVLLDFFAVWCGPCIKTFPDLRRWHEKYAGKGLHIIGVSEYHRYGWDSELGRATKVPDIEPAAEREAMAQFSKKYELPYPVAFVADKQLQHRYIVNGIPHAVLIDRRGKLRLFRIGAVAENARDLEQAIKQCLAEPADPE